MAPLLSIDLPLIEDCRASSLLHRQRELSETARLLARELELASTQRELQRLTKSLGQPATVAQRERLVAEYRIAAQTLPPAHRAEAMAKLTSFVGRARRL